MTEDVTREANGQFGPGSPGRPKGSRNRISEAMLKALADDFDTHGVGVIEKVRENRPHDYLKIIASLMSKHMEIDDTRPTIRAIDLSDDELAAIIAGQV